ncbi:MAG: cell division protein DivIVA [Erysipelotrichaceae bacterium]|nr:cell division protein DivIVA [Erysipelotrichaceae bacterium]MBQ4343955.1 DivIVA domain-containing protein [Erysipelotrichaceae bacterium]
MAAVKPQFRMMKNGYDRFAVDDAIERYQSEIEALEKKLELYGRQVETATEQLNMIKTRYQSLVTELAVKEKAADDISRMALKEANSIIDTAQNNADSIVREALSTARLILVDVSRLTSEISGMKSEVRTQLTSLMKSLDEFTIPALPALEWLESTKLIEEEKK